MQRGDEGCLLDEAQLMTDTSMTKPLWSAPLLCALLACSPSSDSDSGGRYDSLGSGSTSPTGVTATNSGASAGSESSEASTEPIFDIQEEATAEQATTDCANVEVDTSPVTPTVVLLIDQSGSMNDNFGGQQRWVVLQDTLFDPATGIVKALEDEVRFGLALYSSMEGNFGGECPMITEVQPAFGNHATLAATFAAASPLDETPTGESLDEVAEQLALFPEEGPKIILLATDGDPDTCAVPNPQMGQPESIAAAQAAFDMGIRTFVISVGDDVADAHLQELANAGVGLPPQGPDNAPFYKTLNADELVSAFEAVTSGFIGCEFTLEGIVDLDLVCEGEVLLDGEPLVCNEDWVLLDESTLQILGEACATLADGELHTLDASWPCGAVEIL